MSDYTVAELFLIRSQVRSSIPRLFGTSCPPTVFRTVWSIIINALNCEVGFWSATNVSKKVDKLLPSLANVNPTTTVSFPVCIVPIATATTHSTPNNVFRNNFTISSKAMYKMKGWLQFLFKTATTFATTIFQRTTVNESLISAITLTNPFTTKAASSLNYEPSFKSLSRDVFGCWHKYIVNIKWRKVK